jgi:hypothetical protein
MGTKRGIKRCINATFLTSTVFATAGVPGGGLIPGAAVINV